MLGKLSKYFHHGARFQQKADEEHVLRWIQVGAVLDTGGCSAETGGCSEALQCHGKMLKTKKHYKLKTQIYIDSVNSLNALFLLEELQLQP